VSRWASLRSRGNTEVALFRSSCLLRVFVDYYFHVGALVEADGLYGRRLKTELVTSSSRELFCLGQL